MLITDRANWGRLLPVAEAIRASKGLSLHIICGGSSVLERFACPADDIEQAGYSVSRVWHEVEGNTPLTMAMSLGHGCAEYAVELQRCKPDIVLCIGDRFELLGAVSAAATMRIPIVHLQGGEVSGALDERYRHSISKLADWHVPATQQAKRNLIRMGEREDSIIAVGCPSGDLARKLRDKWFRFDTNESGEPVCKWCLATTNAHYRFHWSFPCWKCGGPMRDMPCGHFLVLHHPDTAEPGKERHEMEEILKALEWFQSKPHLQGTAYVLWPNIDSGSDGISKAIRAFGPRDWLETVKNWPAEKYLQMLASAQLCIGNSSSFVRDSSFFGAKVLLLGTRQDERERSENVTTCHAVSSSAITALSEDLINRERYKPSTLYGDGHVSERIVEALLKLPPYRHKRLDYPADCTESNRAFEQVMS